MRRVSIAAPLAVALAAGLLAAAPASAADGAYDLTFWGDGRYAGSAAPDNLGLEILIEAPDGRLVWVGYRQSTSYYRAAWRRVDDAIESGCVLVLPTSSFAIGQTASFDASGRLVVAGFAQLDAGGAQQLLFARYYYPTCVLDPTFGGDGVVLVEVPGVEFLNLSEIVHDGDAIYFVGGVLPFGADVQDGLVGRLRPEGTFDPAFSNDGLLLFDGRAGSDFFEAIELAPGGRLFVGGAGNLPDGTHGDFYLLGLQANGTPIPGFGLDGLVMVDFDVSATSPDDYLLDLALLPGGGFALAGTASGDPGPPAAALAVLDANGDLDPTFDVDGKLVDLQRVEYRSLVAQGNGRLLLAAVDLSYASIQVARRLLSGGLDPAFAGGSWVPVAFPEGGVHSAMSLALQGGRVAAGGTLHRAPTDDNLAAVARLQNAYVFADGFEIGSTWFWSSRTP